MLSGASGFIGCAAAIFGAILHVFYAEQEKTLARVAAFLSDPQRSLLATLRQMMTTNHLGDDKAPRVHPVVASAARELLKSENERSGVLSTAMSFLARNIVEESIELGNRDIKIDRQTPDRRDGSTADTLDFDR